MIKQLPMSSRINARVVGKSLVVIGLLMLVANWFYLFLTKTYFDRVAMAAPVVIALGFDVILFKRTFNRIPFRVTHLKASQWISLIIGILLGVGNVWLMQMILSAKQQ